MLDIIKRTRLLYMLYNFFHKNQLMHNVAMFKKLGIHKKYYSSISNKDFEGLDEKNNAKNFSLNKQAIAAGTLFKSLSDTSRESVLSFEENGFAVINNYLTNQQVDDINLEIELLLKQKIVKVTNTNKIMFAIHSSLLLSKLGNDGKLKALLAALLGGSVTLFQSINFLTGSEQPTHSDSIHMTTYPLGGLLGVWIALEDITEENGPLHYYPQSHKLPYYLNSDYANEGNFFFLGNKSYTEYERMISAKIEELHLKKVRFFAKKGDLLIWHANLFHGGEAHTNKSKSRKSMVLHYFKNDAICYHEITQRPALIKQYSYIS